MCSCRPGKRSGRPLAAPAAQSPCGVGWQMAAALLIAPAGLPEVSAAQKSLAGLFLAIRAPGRQFQMGGKKKGT